ncbi:hypothetical protein D3C80_1721560 [compost metagenome]
MLAANAGTGKRLTEAVDQVGPVLSIIGAVQLTGLEEVLLALDPGLLSAAAQGRLAIACGLIGRARGEDTGLVIHAAGGLVRVHRAILVAVVHAHPWAIDRQAQGVGADAVHLGVGIGEQPAL